MIDKLWQFFRRMGFSEGALWALAYGLLALGVLSLIAFIVWAVRRIRRRSRPPEEQVPEFRKVWRTFLSHIPGEFQRAVDVYQHFIALGEAGSGKSLLIDLYTDWQGQARQFYPSYSSDPDLQVYLGSQAVVQEVPAALLNDINPALRASLHKHWRKLYRKRRDPIVVVSINGSSLSGLTPETLKRQAQLLRGKIDVLSYVKGKRIDTRVVLTHMDEVPGYSEFIGFLKQHRIPFTITLKATNVVEGLEDSLVPYEDHRTRMLKSMPGQDFMRVMSFLQDAPALLNRLADFITILTERQASVLEPAINEVYLSSSTPQREAANPYHLESESTRLRLGQRPSLKHKLAAAALVLAFGVFLSLNFSHELAYWQRGELAVESFAASPAERVDDQVRGRDYAARVANLEIKTYIEQEPGWPSFIGAEKRRALNAAFADAVRDRYLLPRLRGAIRVEGGSADALYLLALIYASRGNELGATIDENLADISELVGLPSALIRDYIAASAQPWSGRVEELSQVLAAVRPFDSDADFTRWKAFLETIEPLMTVAPEKARRGAFTAPDLRALKAEGRLMRTSFDQVRQRLLAMKLVNSETLKRLPEVQGSLGRLEGSGLTTWIDANMPSLMAILREIEAARLDDTPRVEDMNLLKFMTSFRALRTRDARDQNRFDLELGGDAYRLSLGSWDRLLTRSKARRFAQDYIGAARRDGTLLFFSSQNVFEDILLNASNDGSFLYEGRSRIPGRYTRLAFERQVKGAIEGLGVFLEEMEAFLDKGLRGRLELLVASQIESYSQRYAQAYLDYYASYRVRAKSKVSLKLIIQELRLPLSPFADFLETLKDNTDLGQLPPMLSPMTRGLLVFAPVNKLLVAPEGGAAEIEKYRAILGQISARLKAKGGGEGAPEDKDFRAALTPAGGMALDILRRNRESYLKLTRAWLKSVGLVGDLEGPFIEPLTQLYLLGLEDIEALVAGSWSRVVYPLFERFLRRFPFDRLAEANAEPAALAKAFKPKSGAFWLAFKKSIAPVLEGEPGDWRPPEVYLEAIELPEGLLERANKLHRLSRLLWKETGEPRPLRFSVQPAVLPSSQIERPFVTVSYLSCGASSAFGFNQRPTWQDLEVAWWKPEAAEVGIQVIDGRDRKKTFAAQRTGNVTWNLYRLLAKGQVIEPRTYGWVFPEGVVPLERIAFEAGEDPWAALDIDPRQRREKKKKTQGEGER